MEATERWGFTLAREVAQAAEMEGVSVGRCSTASPAESTTMAWEPTESTPPTAVTQWLREFEHFSDDDKRVAIAAFVPKCGLRQLRQLHALVEPLLQRDFVSHLPQELSLFLLGFLDYKSICAAAQVSRSWYRLANDNVLWKKLCERNKLSDSVLRSYKSPEALSREGIRWKDVFFAKHRLKLNWQEGRFVSRSLVGHNDHVITCLQLHDDLVLSGSDDCTLMLWSSITGECLRTYTGHKGGVWCCHFGGDTIVSGSTDKSLKVWDVATGECRYTLMGHTSTVRCLDVQGSLVVSGSRDSTLRVWSISNKQQDGGHCLFVLKGHTAAVRCVAFSGDTIVSGSYDMTLKVWDASKGVLRHTLSGHTAKIYSLQFQGDIIASGSMDASVRVWSASTGVCLRVLVGHRSLVGLMHLRGNILVSGNADETIRVWDITTGVCLNTLMGHHSSVTCVQFDEDKILSGSDDGTVRLWDTKSGQLIRNPLLTVAPDDTNNAQQQPEASAVWRVQYNDAKLVCAVRGPVERYPHNPYMRASDGAKDGVRIILLDFSVNCP